jgi:predicted RNase H-like HicB family nuclease/PHD/YefM family antitoxin component YafN of YafNO toxin-antitoxin module
MNEMTVEQFAQDVPAALETSQCKRVVIMRDGKPVAVLVGIEHKDLEDWHLELSPEFWRMIEERRREPASISLEDLKAELFDGKDWSCHYSMLIQWSDADHAFTVTLPEFAPHDKVVGDTYEEAAQHGREKLEALITTCHKEGRALPVPAKGPSPVPVA